MARKRQGRVVPRRWKSGLGYALRFHALGTRQYVTLGLESEGWTRERAHEELENVMADVRRGIWVPPDRNRARRRPEEEPAEPTIPTFHELASTVLAGREGEVAERTIEYETWALTHHLLPFFATHRVDEIDIALVDDYRRSKVAESRRRREAIERGEPLRVKVNGRMQPLKPLNANSTNKTIDVLQSILAVAVEYGYVADNAAAGRRRRLKVPARRPVHLDSSEQIQAVLDAASELDALPRYHVNDRRAMVATLLFAGLRAHELCLLRWRDVDLANGRITVGRSKTRAGLREIDLLPILRDVLVVHKANSDNTGPDDLVFPTSKGTARDKDNLRNRILMPVVKRADELLAARRKQPLPRGVRPHKLRHTFASILVACGVDPASVMHQLGHTDPKFTLRVYAHTMRRDPAERARLRALVYGEPLEHADDAPLALAA